MTPPRPRKHKLPDNLTFDEREGRYRNPLTGARTRMGRDREHAIKKATLFNQAVELKREQLALADNGTPTVSYVIDQYVVNVVPFKPWAESTR